MLAEKKKKMRLPLDPNNKNWTEDTSSFGRKMMEKMGWKTGQGLGLKNDGTTGHIKISVKDDNLGIGASQKDCETGWLTNSKSYQEVLDRLSKSHEVKEAVDSDSDSDDKSRKDKSEKSKDKKSEKKSKNKDIKKSKNKDVKKSKKSDKKKSKKSIKEMPKSEESKPTVLKSAHRAKFIRNKAVSSYSEANLKEILGGFNI